MKKWMTVIGLVLVMSLLVSVLAVGCGIPREEYNAAVTEKDALQAQVTSLETELTKVQDSLRDAEVTNRHFERVASRLNDRWYPFREELAVMECLVDFWVIDRCRWIAGVIDDEEFENEAAEYMATVGDRIGALESSDLTMYWQRISKEGVDPLLRGSPQQQEGMIEIYWYDAQGNPLPLQPWGDHADLVNELLESVVLHRQAVQEELQAR